MRPAARAANEIRRIERLVVLACVAPSLTREVRVRALETHEVRVPIHGVPVAIVVPLARGVDDLLGLGESFEFEALQGFLLHQGF